MLNDPGVRFKQISFQNLAAILLEACAPLPQILPRQGPWNVDLRTPRGPEGSNGSLLRVCRGHPGTFSMQNIKCKIQNGEAPAAAHFAFLIYTRRFFPAQDRA